MEALLLFAAVAIAVTALLKVLERGSREYAVLLSLAAALAGLVVAARAAQPLLSAVQEWLQWTQTDAEWVRILLRVLGTCLLCQTAAAVCRDAGEGSLAFGVETLCRVAVLVQAMPLLQQVTAVVAGLLQG